MSDESIMHNRTVERIIRSRGDIPVGQRAEDEGEELSYVAALMVEGFPQLGFSIFHATGARQGFFYHNMDNLDLIDIKGVEYLLFTHRGKAVTLRGTQLGKSFQALLDHTLQALYEYHPDLYPPLAGNTSIIDRINVIDTTRYLHPDLFRDGPLQ